MSAHPLPGVLAYLAPVLTNYGYFAVGGFITLEDFGVPVPGETILIAAAVYAGAGKLNVVTIFTERHTVTTFAAPERYNGDGQLMTGSLMDVLSPKSQRLFRLRKRSRLTSILSQTHRWAR